MESSAQLHAFIKARESQNSQEISIKIIGRFFNVVVPWCQFNSCLLFQHVALRLLKINLPLTMLSLRFKLIIRDNEEVK